jgi:hypothetical protein
VRRHPKRFAKRPRDPRSRAVVDMAHEGARVFRFRLGCGHDVTRKVGLCVPSRLICTACPNGGTAGLGGNIFPSSPAQSPALSRSP